MVQTWPAAALGIATHTGLSKCLEAALGLLLYKKKFSITRTAKVLELCPPPNIKLLSSSFSVSYDSIQHIIHLIVNAEVARSTLINNK